MAFYRTTNAADTALASDLDQTSLGIPAGTREDYNVFSEGVANQAVLPQFRQLNEVMQQRADLNARSRGIRQEVANDDMKQKNEDEFKDFNDQLQGIGDNPKAAAALVADSQMKYHGNPLFQGLGATFSQGQDLALGVGTNRLKGKINESEEKTLDATKDARFNTAVMLADTANKQAIIESQKLDEGMGQTQDQIYQNIGASPLKRPAMNALSSMVEILGDDDPTNIAKLGEIAGLSSGLSSLSNLAMSYQNEMSHHSDVINTIRNGSGGALDPFSTDAKMQEKVGQFVKNHGIQGAWSNAQDTIGHFQATQQSYNDLNNLINGDSKTKGAFEQLHDLLAQPDGKNSLAYKSMMGQLRQHTQQLAGVVGKNVQLQGDAMKMQTNSILVQKAVAEIANLSADNKRADENLAMHKERLAGIDRFNFIKAGTFAIDRKGAIGSDAWQKSMNALQDAANKLYPKQKDFSDVGNGSPVPDAATSGVSIPRTTKP